MAFLNVVYCNHMDLSWRRPRYVAGQTNGYWFAPYSEIQERQIDAGLDFIREGGKYDLEQTISLREYLERNPDLFDEVAEMIRDGKLTMLGGGESIIDYNLSDGESIVRNHVYSRRWLREVFDYAPTLAACPDTFGLSAGLPGLFRQLGYRGLSYFHRIFLNNKPYWKGLSGDVVALDSARVQSKMNAINVGYYRKIRACTICNGKGCGVCGGLGAEFVFDPDCAERFMDLKDHLNGIEGDAVITQLGEESALPEKAVAMLQQLAEETNRTLRFLSSEELSNIYTSNLLERVDEAAEKDIDDRIEGNPVAAGCYTSRIRIKKEVRYCESLLRTAERLAVAAALEDEKYPVKTLEYWWRKLFYLLFHDSVPGSHSDDANEELMETARMMRSGLYRIIDRSMKKLLRKVAVEDGKGIPFAVFNPLEFDVENARFTGVIHCDHWVEGGRIIAPDGSECDVLSFKHTQTPDSNNAQVEFIGSLPAFGYGIYRFIPMDEFEVDAKYMKRGCVMENNFLRIEFGPYSIKSIFDKVKNCEIACEGTFSPVLHEDAGHLWGRSCAVLYSERADMPQFSDNMLPAQAFERKVSYLKGKGFQRVDITVKYGRQEHQVKHLDWTAEFMLPDDSDELSVRIRTCFDARDTKLLTQVVLPKAPVDGLLDYEIPLGVVARGPVATFDGMLEHSDEWAALRYVSANLGDTRVTLCNNGTPAHSIDGNVIRVSLLRNPTLLCCGFGIEKAIDPTENVFDFTLRAGGNLMDAYRGGMKLNTNFPATAVIPQDGILPKEGRLITLPTDCVLLGLKGAEDGNGFVARYLGGEESKAMKFSAPVTACNLLEDAEGEPDENVTVPRYTITTWRLSADALKR